MIDPQLTQPSNTWIELSKEALKNNIAIFKSLLDNQLLMCVVKANAYGHGMIPIATEAIKHGANWLGVFSVAEGLQLREAGITVPILVLGPTVLSQIEIADQYNLRLTIASLNQLSTYCNTLLSAKTPVHLKLETGTNRQGISFNELTDIPTIIKQSSINIEGAYTHFADIEDTTNHEFATTQLTRFKAAIEKLALLNLPIKLPHTACTAATILFSDTYFKLVRVGIGTYGLWPSKETQVSAKMLGKNQLGLTPVMTWKTRIAQVKTIAQGEYVGYGRTFRATRDTQVAILPIGYFDGYSRHFSNAANVLVNNLRARVLGRVCMNLTMIDVTDIPDVKEGTEVILLGKSDNEQISAEDLAAICGTINYEIVTRAAPTAPRIWNVEN